MLAEKHYLSLMINGLPLMTIHFSSMIDKFLLITIHLSLMTIHLSLMTIHLSLMTNELSLMINGWGYFSLMTN